ncbi:hypothetical protein VCHENC02_5759B, partial [Vibrio harveyi]
ILLWYLKYRLGQVQALLLLHHSPFLQKPKNSDL